MKKGMLPVDPAWVSYALSSFNLLTEFLHGGVLYKLFFH